MLTECDTPTAKLWLMYIVMVNILERYIHAEKAGIWKEHLGEAEEMLPYEPRHEKTVFFAYAKTKTQISFAVTGKLISAFVFAT